MSMVHNEDDDDNNLSQQAVAFENLNLWFSPLQSPCFGLSPVFVVASQLSISLSSSVLLHCVQNGWVLHATIPFNERRAAAGR